jgi:RNA polymerase sigma-70 factor (ECF subfamily)
MAAGDGKALLERARRYDQEALAEIYDQYASKIYSYIYYRVGDARLAEDLTASVFLNVLEAIRGNRAWYKSFSAWLYRIAHNIVVDQFRRKGKLPELPLDERLVSNAEDPSKGAELALEIDWLEKAVRDLTDDQSEVIILKFIEGLTNSEVASVLGKTEGAVKSLQYRALASLRRMLESEEKRAEEKRH